MSDCRSWSKEVIMKKIFLLYLWIVLIVMTGTDCCGAAAQEVENEPTQTLFEAIVRRVTGERFLFKIQKIIFDYVQDFARVVAFIYETPDEGMQVKEVEDGNLRRALRETDVPIENINAMLGLDYAGNYHSLLKKPTTNKYKTLDNRYVVTEQGSLECALNQSHFGAWFAPSSEEKLLLVPCDDKELSEDDIAGVARLALPELLKQNLEAFAISEQMAVAELQVPYKLKMNNFFKSLEKKLKEQLKKKSEEIVLQDQQTRFNVLTGFPLVVQNIVYEYLKEKAVKEKIVLKIPEGFGLIASTTIHLQPWEKVDYIIGKDSIGKNRKKRLHAIIDECSDFETPDHFASSCIKNQEYLAKIAAKKGAQFLVPSRQEVWLHELITVKKQNGKKKCVIG